jgi:hypothetical protein
MAESRFKPVTKDELPALVERAIKTSVGYYDSKLSKERKDVLDYYNGVLPRPLHNGNSRYVSMDVYDSVESLKAVLLETFASGNRIVEFQPQTAEDVEMAKIATDYCDYVVFRQNDGFKIFSDAIQDGLIARVGVSKVYWDECTDVIEEEFDNLTVDEVDMLISGEDYEDINFEVNEDTGLFKGTVTRQVNKSQVRIDAVPPEEFLITPQAKDIQSAAFIAHRTRKTYSELIEMGFKKSLVEKISANDDSELTMNPEVLARFEQIGADRLNLNGQVQEQTRPVIVYECYLHLDMDGTGEAKLWKVTKSGSVILDYERVDHKPFVSFTPLPIPHSFYGSNYASKVVPTQNARSTLIRGILDHTLITNNPRMMVVKGALTNPKELIENRIGGLVNVTRPDGIMPLPQASMNPFVFQTIQLLDEDKEEATGVSKLSQGMNKDAVSKQNSGAMVESLVSLSQQREKIIARAFANQYLKELYKAVFRLVIANEVGEKVVQIAGKFVRVYPSTWDDSLDVTVEMKLGYGEQENDARKALTWHSMMSQDQGVGAMYSQKNKYAVLCTALEKSGVKNISDYLTPPDQIPPPQPDPMAMKQMELQERTVAAQELAAQTQAEKVKLNAELDHMKLEMQQMAQEFANYKAERELERKQFDSTARVAIQTEELEILKQTPPEQTRGIVSPT